MDVEEVKEKVFSEDLGLSAEQIKSLLMLIRSVDPDSKKELVRAVGRQLEMVAKDLPQGATEPNARTFWDEIFVAVWKKMLDF